MILIYPTRTYPLDAISQEEYPLSLSGEFPSSLTQSIKHEVTLTPRRITNDLTIFTYGPYSNLKQCNVTYMEMLMSRMIHWDTAVRCRKFATTFPLASRNCWFAFCRSFVSALGFTGIICQTPIPVLAMPLLSLRTSLFMRVDNLEVLWNYRPQIWNNDFEVGDYHK